jgi:hypothetical protein
VPHRDPNNKKTQRLYANQLQYFLDLSLCHLWLTLPAMNSTSLFSQWRRNPFKSRKPRYASEVSQVSDLPDLPDLPNPPILPIAESKSKTWATSVTHVPSWPQDARPLKKRNWIVYLYSVADMILVLLPIYFIRMCTVAKRVLFSLVVVLCIAVIKLNGKPTKDNEFGTKVEFAIQLVSRYKNGKDEIP